MPPRGDFPSSKLDQYMLRFPDGMREQLKAAAAANNRSLNAEIIARLERSFLTWPHISVPTWIMERVNAAPPERRMGAEAQINTLVEDFLEQQFPDPLRDANALSEQFSNLVRRAPEELRAKYQREFEQLVLGILAAEGEPPSPAPSRKLGRR